MTPLRRLSLTVLAGSLLVTPSWAVLTHSTLTKPRIAIIIDDMGYNKAQSASALQLPPGITYSFIPLAPFTATLAHQAVREQREIMLHLPMESLGGPTREQDLLRNDMNRKELLSALHRHLRALPQAVGINNHMGSRLTANTTAMSVLMEAIKPTGLYFIDSRTTVSTVAATLAQHYNIPQLSRDVFLDNVETEKAIDAAFDHLLEKARKNGFAIAIGHPYPTTLKVLKKRVGRLSSQGYTLAPASHLIRDFGRTQAPALPWPTYLNLVSKQPSPSTLQRIARASVE